MGKKDSKRYRGREKDPGIVYGFADLPPSNIAEEKQKARKLRASAWWKRKIADGLCYYCQKKFSPDELTMDHLIPLSRGGTSDKINIVPCCKECNNKKNYMLPVEWDDYLNRIGKSQP